jgi:hypothetical protein
MCPTLRLHANDCHLPTCAATRPPQSADPRMPALCGPAALDPEPADEVVAVAWTAGGVLVSAAANGAFGARLWGAGGFVCSV